MLKDLKIFVRPKSDFKRKDKRSIYFEKSAILR